jgi:DNA-binding PadR family transcriptional regulator
VPRSLGYATIAVLNAIADGVSYGFDIIDRTALPSGTVYPALAALERRGLVASRWERTSIAHGEGRPRRRYYQVTAEGRKAMADALERLNALGLRAPSPEAEA